MEILSYTAEGYLRAGKPFILVAGELHYFRVPRREWRRRMELFLEAGGNAVGTYIPWLLHEPEEGQYRFESSDGTCNLESYLELAAELGLWVIARPGPYQYSEMLWDGLPGWLVERYPEILARTVEGRPFRASSVSYLHPRYMEKVRQWYGQVCPILARNTVSRGGPVALMQIDNEMTGVHRWFSGFDYNAETMGFGCEDGRYPRFLQRKYGSIEALNWAYGTEYGSFAEVRPLGGNSTRPQDLRRRKDYADLYWQYVAEYAQFLAGLARDAGVDVPLIHNAANPLENAFFKETVAALGDELVQGSDHYYNLSSEWERNNPSPLYAAHCYLSLETLRLLRCPPTVWELPGGSLIEFPPITATDLRTCYFANLAMGMKGSDYYIFTGGPNPPGLGANGDVYDYQAAISADGAIRPSYYAQQEYGRFVAAHPWLAEAQGEYDCRIAFDWEQARAADYWPQRGLHLFSTADAFAFLRRDLLPTAFCAGMSVRLVDLGQDDWLSDTRTPLIVPAAVCMAKAAQERLVRYLEGGGRALFLPVLPTLNEEWLPCRQLADRLGAPELEACTIPFPQLTVAGVRGIHEVGELFHPQEDLGGVEILGCEDRTGRPVAWSCVVASRGEAAVLAYRWRHTRRSQEQMLRALLLRLGWQPRIQSSNPNVWTTLRTSGRRSLLFLLNLWASPMDTSVGCRPSWSDTWIEVGECHLPPMTVKTIELAQ